MKYKIRYLFNKFYHLIKFIIPTFFIGMLSVNANVVPYECRQYDNYFNVGSVYTNNSSSYSSNRDSNFYNLDTYILGLSYMGASGNEITYAPPVQLNTCTSNETDENTGEVTIQNNYKLYEYTTLGNNNTADVYSVFNSNSNIKYIRLNMWNKIQASNIGTFTIDKNNDKIIFPMYYRSNKSNLTFDNIIKKISFVLNSNNPLYPISDLKQTFTFNFDIQNDNVSDYIYNYTMYYEENYFYYYTFDLVIPLNNFSFDGYTLPQTYQNYKSQEIYLDIYPNLDFILDSENSPFGLFIGSTDAFFISDEVLQQSNWIETGIEEWVITNNPSETLGPLQQFFNNFNLQDNRGISQIITIPIRIVQSFLSSSCDSISIDIFTSRNDDNLTIQSGCSFWNRMTPIKNLLNIFVDGFICFEILKAIYLEIDKLKDPSDKSKLERSDL